MVIKSVRQLKQIDARNRKKKQEHLQKQPELTFIEDVDRKRNEERRLPIERKPENLDDSKNKKLDADWEEYKRQERETAEDGGCAS